MSSTMETAAENSTLFAIDQELEAVFVAAGQELEQGGRVSDQTRERCLELFAEFGKKVDRVAHYVRATELKARAAREEAARLTAREKAAETRARQVKGMLTYFMHARGLRRLEGELNSIRLQGNGLASLEIDTVRLPAEYSQVTIVLAHPDWVRILESIASPEQKKLLEEAVIGCEPNRRQIREHLEAGEDVVGARLAKGEHVRFD